MTATRHRRTNHWREISMNDPTDRANQLEAQVCRLRRTSRLLTAGLAVLLAALALGATTPQELTLRKLIIADAQGKTRITLATAQEGNTGGLWLLDPSGKIRMAALTSSDGM